MSCRRYSAKFWGSLLKDIVADVPFTDSSERGAKLTCERGQSESHAGWKDRPHKTEHRMESLCSELHCWRGG